MLENARDVAIVLLAAESILLLTIMVFIAWKAYHLLGLARSKAEEFSALGKALLDNARQTAETAGQTATTVKGSAEFLSDTVVNPVMEVVSAAAGARSFVAALFRLPSSRKDGGHS